jgi:hypothetical protein
MANMNDDEKINLWQLLSRKFAAPTPAPGVGPMPNPEPFPSPAAEMPGTESSPEAPPAPERKPAMTPQEIAASANEIRARMSAPSVSLPVNTDVLKYGEDIKQQSKKETLQTLTPEQIATLTAEAEKSPGIREQRAGIKDMQELLAMRLKMKPQLDLTPAMALSDAWFGGNLKSSYKAPPSSQELFEKLSSHMTEIQKRKQDTSDKINDFIRNTRQGGSLTEQLINGLTAGRTYGQEPVRSAGGVQPQEKAYEKVWEVFYRHGKPVFEAYDMGKAAREALNQGTSLGDEVFKKFVTQVMRDPRPTDRDMAVIAGDRRLAEKFKQYINWSFGQGAFTELNYEEMNQLLNGLDRLNQKRLGELVEGHSRAGAQAHPAISTSEFNRFITSRLGGESYIPKGATRFEGPRQTRPQSAPKAGPMSPEEWLKANGGK